MTITSSLVCRNQSPRRMLASNTWWVFCKSNN